MELNFNKKFKIFSKGCSIEWPFLRYKALYYSAFAKAESSTNSFIDNSSITFNRGR